MYLVQLRELNALLWGAAPSDGGDVQHPIAKLDEGSSVGGQGHKVTWSRVRKTEPFHGNGCPMRHAASARGTKEERSPARSWGLGARQRPGINNSPEALQGAHSVIKRDCKKEE